jgi:hypothetical protein
MANKIVQIVKLGSRLYYRLFCLNPACQKVFFRPYKQGILGRDKHCSKACRYGWPSGDGGSIALSCVVCGAEIKRYPSAAHSKLPFCSHFCMKLHQSAERSVTQVVYSPALLLAMAKHEGENCAFPGCNSAQYQSKHPRFNNPFHVCKLHRIRIKNAMKQRQRQRKNILRNFALANFSEEAYAEPRSNG